MLQLFWNIFEPNWQLELRKLSFQGIFQLTKGFIEFDPHSLSIISSFGHNFFYSLEELTFEKWFWNNFQKFHPKYQNCEGYFIFPIKAYLKA
jgi:hypothetical protein